MKFPRSVEPEILDSLEPADPRAIQSRRDLTRVNTLMGHTRILARALRHAISGSRIVELGAGDGTCLLRVAKRLGPTQVPIRAVLVDRRPSVSPDTRAHFSAAGWDVHVHQADALEWLERAEAYDVTIANLFLHHFAQPALADLLAHICVKTRTLVACEPRRSGMSLVGAHLLRCVGCSDDTLHDARVSVRAGFRGYELSSLWPNASAWHLREQRAGLFTHVFVASHAP